MPHVRSKHMVISDVFVISAMQNREGAVFNSECAMAISARRGFVPLKKALNILSSH